MKVSEAIKMLERNRDANPGKPKFQEACNMAITALKENRPLKNRCRALSQSALCAFCQMKCPELGGEDE
jgi:coenzyme F420-reducing hydrogenase gamma subunit